MSPYLDLTRQWPQPLDPSIFEQAGMQQEDKSALLQVDLISTLAPGELLTSIKAAGLSPDIQIDFRRGQDSPKALAEVLAELQDAGITPEVHLNFQLGEKGGD